jgi:multiple sugar transport system ATP-binding protein
MVFQNYALYPHLTVRRNMGFGLRMRGLPSAEIDRRVNEAARVLGVEHLFDRRPKALSGGQRQRVALGRAIVREPLAFLMDEPLSNLDASLRVRMRAEISALHQRLGVTTVYVTHDQIEAMTMADRIVIMRDGDIQQIAPPDEMFSRPANLFVAGFIGSPSMNFLRAKVSGEGGGGAVKLFGQMVRLAAPLDSMKGREVVIGVRPEHVTTEGAIGFTASPRLVESLGSEKYVHVDVPEENRASGVPSADETRADLLVARLINAGPVAEGAPLRLAFNPGNLHIFDATSGRALTHAPG